VGTKNKSKKDQKLKETAGKFTRGVQPSPPGSAMLRRISLSKGSRNPRIESYSYKLEVNGTKFFARVCNAVTQAICEFYAQGSASMTFEDLYR
jgi:hypothetical protein